MARLTGPCLRSRALAYALPFAAAAALSAATILHGIQPNDEGLMLQAASRIAHGAVPYRDFWWYYPPGQPYLLAGLWKLLGPSLVTWRVVRVLADATVALLAYRLARREAPRPLAIVAWLGAAGAMAFPSGPHPFPIALALALGSLLLFERAPVRAGVLAGLCAAWRIEFAAYLVLGILLAEAVGGGPWRSRALTMARFAASGLLVAALLYVPVVAAAGLGPSWRLLVRYPLVDFSAYQSLPFPLHYDGLLNTSSLGGFLADSAESILHFYLPLALVAGAIGVVLVLVPRARGPRLPRLVAVPVFAAGMLAYLLVRADLFHTAPLAVMFCVLASWALAGLRSRVGTRRLLLAPGIVVAGALVWVLAEGIERRVRGLTETTVPLALPVADGVRVIPPRAPPLERAVRFLRARVGPGRPIYVATRRSDLVTSGDPLFYVLAGRTNPTRYDIAAPGVLTTAPVQREIVVDLRRARPALVVRFTDRVTALPEPDRAGRSSGVRILDRFLARAYRPTARFGPYLILVRRT